MRPSARFVHQGDRLRRAHVACSNRRNRSTKAWRLPTTWVGPRPAKSGRRIEAVPECGGEIQFPWYGQARPLVPSERVDAKNGLTTNTRPHCPQESCTVNDLQMSMDPIGQQYRSVRWTPLDSNIEVFGDANFAGCHSTRKSTVEVLRCRVANS